MTDSPAANAATVGAFACLMSVAFLWGLKPPPQATAAVSLEAELVVAETGVVAPQIQMPSMKQRKRSFVERHGLSVMDDAVEESSSSSSRFRDVTSGRLKRAIIGANELAIDLADPSDGTESASGARTHVVKGESG